MSLTRRELLRSAPLVAAGVAFASRSSLLRADGLIVRMQEPRNVETPLSDLKRDITANERFYVRSHFSVPTIDPKTFKLTVEGHVEKRLELTLDELQKMEAVSKEMILECAGNGRVFLVPPARGLQWGNGAVGNAKWTGVPLGTILERARVKAGAVDVVLIGADKGTIADPATPGAINFDRGIPLAKAGKDETLLAWSMNDEPLPASHGAPLRAVVGGWYGMASVKWLTRIVVTDKPHAGFWQTLDYSIWDRKEGASPQLIPVTAIEPKAIITSHGPNDALTIGKQHLISGLAWAGEEGVKKVEVSWNDGKTWDPTALEAGKPYSWSHWGMRLTPQVKGPLKLLVRCTDAMGKAQPEKRDPDRRSYLINHLVAVELIVK